MDDLVFIVSGVLKITHATALNCAKTKDEKSGVAAVPTRRQNVIP